MKGWYSMVEQRIRRFLYGSHDVPPRTREVSHTLANEVSRLNANVSRIERAQDPWHELVKAIRGHECDEEEGLYH